MQTLQTEMFAPVLAWLDAQITQPEDETGLQLNMGVFQSDRACGTACCIAGALQIFNNLELTFTAEEADLSQAHRSCAAVGRAVGMTEDQVEDLFLARNNPYIDDSIDLDYIQPFEAAGAIRAMLATGAVAWPEPRPEDL